jgi:gluconolactonase
VSVHCVPSPRSSDLATDEKTLIVANSNAKKPYWYAFGFDENDWLTNGRIFYDASEAAKTEHGLPDGLKIDRNGNIFATGPGGVWIFNKDAKPLGKIKFPHPTSNCAFSPDQKTLYITADMYVLRIKLR